MIKISVEKTNNFYKKISLTGHAHYAESGRDIVCSAVSSIVITTVNAALSLDEKCLNYDESKGMKIEIIKENENINKLMDNMLNLLKELENDYPKNIKII